MPLGLSGTTEGDWWWWYARQQSDWSVRRRFLFRFHGQREGGGVHAVVPFGKFGAQMDLRWVSFVDVYNLCVTSFLQ